MQGILDRAYVWLLFSWPSCVVADFGLAIARRQSELVFAAPRDDGDTRAIGRIARCASYLPPLQPGPGTAETAVELRRAMREESDQQPGYRAER